MSSDTSTEESDSDDDLDDSKLLLEIRKKFKRLEEETNINEIKKLSENNNETVQEVLQLDPSPIVETPLPSVEEQVNEDLVSKEESAQPPTKKKRIGLVQEIIISVSKLL